MKIAANTTFVLQDGTEVTVGELFEVFNQFRFRPILPNEDKHLYELRKQRHIKCFNILDRRGKFWYNDLTDEQYVELKNWRQAWLDVTETLIEPATPKWINNKLEGEQIL
jgi:hypothetical protein